MRVRLLFLLASTLALGACTKSESRAAPKESTQPVPAKVDQAIDASASAMKEAVDAAQTKYDELAKRLMAAGGDVDALGEKASAELTEARQAAAEKVQALEAKLGELRGAAGEEWRKVEEGVRNAATEAESALDALGKKLGE